MDLDTEMQNKRKFFQKLVAKVKEILKIDIFVRLYETSKENDAIMSSLEYRDIIDKQNEHQLDIGWN